jgi:hypothetical protein
MYLAASVRAATRPNEPKAQPGRVARVFRRKTLAWTLELVHIRGRATLPKPDNPAVELD